MSGHPQQMKEVIVLRLAEPEDDMSVDQIADEVAQDMRLGRLYGDRVMYDGSEPMELPSPVVKNLAHGFVGSYLAARKLNSLITNLAWCGIEFRSERSPHEVADALRHFRGEHTRVLLALGSVLSALQGPYADRLQTLIRDIQFDPGALKMYGQQHTFPLSPLQFGWLNDMDPNRLGSRSPKQGGCEGAWRGWVVREVLARIPNVDAVPDKWKTISDLITSVGIDVDANYVGSIANKRSSKEKTIPT